jgi:hypothetical protein
VHTGCARAGSWFARAVGGGFAAWSRFTDL